MVLYSVLAQMPPPPTLAAVAPSFVDMPSLSFWSGTEYIVQWWQQNPTISTGAQIVILVGLVLVGLMVVIYYMRSMTGSEK